jgi:outer membrane immunogenic protein
MRTLAIVTAALLCATVSPQAADLRMPVKAPPPVAAPAFSWTGFYVGGHVGAGWSDAEFDSVTDAIFPGFLFGPPLVLIPTRLGTIPASGVDDVNILGGVQAGFNYQIGQWVFGLEADVSATGLDGSSTFPIFTAPPGFEAGQTLTGTYTTSIDWMASVRGRLGFAWDRFLIYATGGAAFVDADVASSFTLVQPAVPILVPAGGGGGTTAVTASFNEVGWTIGGGVEWAFAGGWSIAAEYRHSDFGSKTITLASTDPSGLLGLPTLTTNVDLTVDQATLRLNYRFGGL